MKLSAALLLSIVSTANAVFEPQRISYQDLLEGGDALLQPLQDMGMISITDIPNFFSQKHKTLSALAPCARRTSEAVEHQFEDGTIRRTLASHSLPSGMQPLLRLEEEEKEKECQELEQASHAFRGTVARVTEDFSKALSSSLDYEKTPLLQAEHTSFSTLNDVVENGEHLEHFHTYHAPTTKPEEEETIEWHTDQGLFIVFTPGMVKGVPSDGFHIKTKDGNTEQVVFSSEDDIIVMLGDGVNQYLNKYVKQDLWAAPHALVMPSEAERVWYGRMVLPPVDAFHPEHDDMTFGHLRQLMIENNDPESKSVGCSSAEMSARQLETTACAEDTLQCWHRCMPLDSEELVSDDICASRGMVLGCINPRGQLSWGANHGDFYPGCVDLNNYENVTDYPELPTSLADTCAPMGVAMTQRSAATTNSEPLYTPSDLSLLPSQFYSHSVHLGSNTTFAWSVTEDGKIRGALSYNDIFGWLAVGFSSGRDNKRKGMYGTSVIMALPGGDYDAATGLDLDMPSTVNEYTIHDTKASFRSWMEPVNEMDLSETHKVIEDDCFTTLTFEASGINGKEFNVTGTDDMIWAGNNEDFFVGYHGRKYRGFFTVNWETGEVLDHAGNYLSTGKVVEDDDNSSEEGEGEGEDSSANVFRTSLSTLALSVLMSFLLR